MDHPVIDRRLADPGDHRAREMGAEPPRAPGVAPRLHEPGHQEDHADGVAEERHLDRVEIGAERLHHRVVGRQEQRAHEDPHRALRVARQGENPTDHPASGARRRDSARICWAEAAKITAAPSQVQRSSASAKANQASSAVSGRRAKSKGKTEIASAAR